MRRLALVLAVVVAAGIGCQKLKVKLGLGDLITNPEPGTPEKVLQDVLKAAREPDEERGWEQFTNLLHGEETTPASLQAWREMKYPAIRKKVDALLKDRAAATFKVMDRREEGRSIQLYLDNSQSDVPTPCRLRQDPARSNAWRVFGACF
jgi:hypothetical protein